MTIVSPPRSSEAGAAKPSETRHIPVRRLNELRPDFQSHWTVPDDPILSHFIATLSAVFPKGEEMFVASVRRHRDAVADNPVLRAQVKGFIGQEAMHGRAHRDFNTHLHDLGYNVERADRNIGRICSRILASRPSRLAIAVTAAAEHFTGLLAEAVLGHESTRTTLFGQESIEPLICWHALEELEHKNVAFDVLAASGGRYPIRAAGFFVTSGVLAGDVLIEWVRSVYEDRHNITSTHVHTFRSNLKHQKLLSWWMVRNAHAYLRPGFHPDDTNTESLVNEWRDRLAHVATPLIAAQ